MDIFQFEQFQMIAECGTMREAAERLFLSQPTLSHNIKKLESELGCKLFTRAGNQLRLTPYGELVLERTREIDGTFKAMLAEVEDMKRREEATLRIGSYSFIASGFVMSPVAAEFPDSRFVIDNCPTDVLKEGLKDSRFDVLLATDVARDKAFKWQKLYTEKAFVSVPRMTKGSGFKWAVLLLMVFGATMLNFSNMVFSARSVDVMAQFGMDQAQLTAVSGIGVLPGALFSVFMGGFFDKRGPSAIRFVGAALLLLAAACQVWRVFATSYVELFVITFLSGAFFLPTQVLPAKMIEAWFDRSEMGTALGVYGAAAGIGITAAFALGALFPTTTMALAFCACGYVAVAAFWLFVARLPQADAGQDLRQASEAAAGGENVSIKAVLKSKNMWLVMVCRGLAAGAPLLYNSYIINAFIDKGMEVGATSLVGVLFNIGLVIGAIVTGVIVSKAGRYNRVYTVFPLVAAAALAASYFVSHVCKRPFSASTCS